MKHTFTVEQHEKGKRIDVYLSNMLPDVSRSVIQRVITLGTVSVNEQPVQKSSYRLEEGDTIIIEITEDPPDKDIIPTEIPLDILYKDKNVVVINKPPGLAVHPAKGNWDNTLVNGLMYHYSDFEKVGISARFGLVHRLDKDTSGVILVALDNQALWHFSRQFEERQVSKYYLAVVGGDFSKKGTVSEKVVSNYIARHPKNRKKMASTEDKKNGKLATTTFYHIDSVADPTMRTLSLVLAMPKTGRTHQIRVHLSELGYPILGDSVYGGKSFKRMLLHAYGLRVQMFDNNTQYFEAPIPSELTDLFEVTTISSRIQEIIQETPQ